MRGFRGLSTPDGWTWVEGEKERFAAHLKGLAPGPFEIHTRRPQRSNPANRRLWALYTVAADELGYESPEELHESVAMHLLKLPPDERTGLPRRKSTAKLTTDEFSAYMQKAEALFVSLGADLSGWDDELERMR